MKVDLIITGRIATLAGSGGFGWVEAIAVAGGRVVLAGDRPTVEREATSVANRLDLPPDRVAIPGLSDGHMHLADLALSADEVDLAGSPTLDDGLARIASAHRSADPDAWLEGHGWDAVRWAGWPLASDLERIAPGRRVALWSHDHHSVWASPSALEAAGVTAATPDPPGGVIRRLDDGSPAGCLQESAASIVLRVVPSPTPERMDAALVAACRDLLSYGLVAVHDPGEVSSDVDLSGGFAGYERLAAAGRLPIRVHASVRPESLELAIARELRSGQPLGDDRSRAIVGWVKIFADGTLGARTARMLRPYERDDASGEPPGAGLGVDVTAPDEVERVVARAAERGISGEIHAIGDAANRRALTVLAPTSGRTPLMPRVEHAQLIDPADLPRFARAGVAACVMPRDIRADRGNAYRFWGRARTENGSYAFGSLVRSGAVVMFGTDAPVESPDPWPAIASAVTRRDPAWAETEPAFVSAEAMPLARALRSACVDAAVAAGEPDRGRLTVGQRADIAVIPAAALVEPVDPRGALETVRPTVVLLDGESAFEA